MSTKTKKKTNTLPIDQLSEIAQQAGVVLMTAAVTLGMLELPEHGNSRIVLPNQPVLATAGENEGSRDNAIRREREETAPHFVSYSEVQRTASRSGKA